MSETGTQERETIVVGADGEETTVTLDRAATPLGFVYVMAHGAGSNMEHATMSAFAREFAAAGIDVVRFNFYYAPRIHILSATRGDLGYCSLLTRLKEGRLRWRITRSPVKNDTSFGH